MVAPTTMVFGLQVRSMVRDCITVKRRSMKANGKMVSAQEEAIVMTSLRNRTIVVISYVDIVMAEEG